ncbi:MAG: CARDB domain-containing protein [Nostoc sp.]|uniref:CARDB domain-containing protein n=1 Tax=Nostoc sp. TaxID=1180 RepID=UPI002FF977B3
MAELTFGGLFTPEGGNLGAIVINPAIPHAQDGFDIEWADANLDQQNAAGAYKDTVWITDDHNTDEDGNSVVVWVQEIDLPGLAPGQSESRVVSVPASAIAPAKYTFHVYIDSHNDVPELDVTDSNNYSFNAGIDVNN